MTLSFGDLLSNALHDIKQQTGKKISILQDEVGYAFDPTLSGDTIEKWRYRKTILSTVQLTFLAQALISYNHPNHDREWLYRFLEVGGDPYPEVACERIFPSVWETVAEKQTIELADISSAPDLAAYRPPASSRFIGRSQELDRYKNQLASRKVTAICGMAGIGKTSLAIEIAQATEPQTAVFWHRFYDQNINTLIRRLAGFLTHFGKSDLWEMIESARLAGVRPPDVTTSLDTLVAQLSGLNLLLCFDDLQFADNSQELIDFLNRLVEPNQEKSGLSMLITSRRFPTFLPADLRSELSGLSAADTSQLLTERGLTLAPEIFAELHKITEGNGAFLTLAAVVLKGSQDPADLIERLATIEDIERFLLEEVNDRLSGQEQRVMEGISVLSGYSGTRDVLEVMLNQRDVRRTLRTLTDQHLLAASEGENGREFSQHQIIQTFYYEQPSRQKRRDMHRSAAEFYELEEVDRFKATLHFAKAGEADRAVQLTAEHLWEIVNQGMAASLLPILESIKAEGLAEDERFELWLAQGQLDSLLGDYDNGRERFELAAAKLQELPVNERTNQLKGRVCLNMAELLERQDPPKALEWGQRGLELLVGKQGELTAELKLIVGAIMMNMGNTGGALEQFLDSDENTSQSSPSLQADINKNLGAIYWHLDNLPLAVKHSEKALTLSKAQRNHIQTARVYTNLGPIKYALEDWEGAISDLENALTIASRLGRHESIMALHINLGRCYYYSGMAAKTVEHLQKGLKLANQSGSQFAIHAQINLAKHYISINIPQTALELLNNAENQAQKANDQTSLISIHAIQANAFCILGDLDKANFKVSKALEESKLIGNQYEHGISWRVKGNIDFKNGKNARANDAFEQSLKILKPLDRFYSALTQLDWGRALFEQNKPKASQKLLKEANQVFSELGALREKQISSNLIQKYQSLKQV